MYKLFESKKLHDHQASNYDQYLPIHDCNVLMQYDQTSM